MISSTRSHIHFLPFPFRARVKNADLLGVHCTSFADIRFPRGTVCGSREWIANKFRRGKSRRRVNRRAIYKAADRKHTMARARARGRLLAYLRKRRIFVFVGNRICTRIKYPTPNAIVSVCRDRCPIVD